MSQYSVCTSLAEVSLLRKFIAGIGHTNANVSYLRTLNESVIRRLFFAVFEKMPSNFIDSHLGIFEEKGWEDRERDTERERERF